MAPETAELIDKIDSERERTDRLIEDADAQVKQIEKDSAQLERAIERSDEKLAAALTILRRAGLLRAS
jgi:uncharacterized protein (DUF2344 family)